MWVQMDIHHIGQLGLKYLYLYYIVFAGGDFVMWGSRASSIFTYSIGQCTFQYKLYYNLVKRTKYYIYCIVYSLNVGNHIFPYGFSN